MVHLWGRDRIRRQLADQPTQLDDDQLGQVRIIRNNGRYIRLNVRTSGEVVVSAPYRASIDQIKNFVAESRDHLQKSLKLARRGREFCNGDTIGRHHKLEIYSGVRANISLSDQLIKVSVPNDYGEVKRDQLIHQAVAKGLRQEASRYLPRRLRQLALKYGYNYQRVRLTFAKTRWGSCSTSGTISLNISLMMLPNELIDYVLLHELAHTKHMNHGPDFWATLTGTLPNARELSQKLKKYSPYI